MGGLDLDGMLAAAHEQLRERQNRQAQLRHDVQELTGEYPGFRFGVIGKGEAGIEAVAGDGYEGTLVAVIRPDAAGIRAVLDVALKRPGGA